jgi:hypothetical protein
MHDGNIKDERKLLQAITLLTRIWQLPGSNLGRYSSTLKYIFLVFLSTPQKAVILVLPQLLKPYFLPHPFELITH